MLFFLLVPSSSSNVFAECEKVTGAFATLMGLFIEELRKADFEALK